MSSAKWRLFRLGLNVLKQIITEAECVFHTCATVINIGCAFLHLYDF